MDAISHDNGTAVQLLLENVVVNIDEWDKATDYTLLHRAASKGYKATVQLLFRGEYVDSLNTTDDDEPDGSIPVEILRWFSSSVPIVWRLKDAQTLMGRQEFQWLLFNKWLEWVLSKANFVWGRGWFLGIEVGGEKIKTWEQRR